MKTFRNQWISLILAAVMLMSAAACNNQQPDETDPGPEMPPFEDVGSASESETEAESESKTETEDITLPDDAELLVDPDADIKETEEESGANESEESKTESETEKEEAKEPSRIYNYLTGKTTTKEERDVRPVAIMVNNIWTSLPQIGVSQGEVYYECAAEGGITRLMMLVSDVEKLGTIGSIRSSRDYFVDFLANHDAIYVHAGGSNQAYEKIIWRQINNIDGVNMYLPTTFWRDQNRLANMGYEHSLMTSGSEIAAAIEYKKYRTELDPKQVPLFQFYEEDTDNNLVGSPATHVHMQSTYSQIVDFVYNEETKEYLRYQYNGMAHVDGANGEQISVKNLLILFTEIDLIPGDTAGRLSVGTVGSGQGYYITNGKRKVINWSREGKTTTMKLEYRDGSDLILNCGKTFICVVDDSVASNIDFEYEWPQ